MTILMFLVPITLMMGLAGLAAFFWSLRSGQYEDLSGAAVRLLYDDDKPQPVEPAGNKTKETTE